MGLDGLLFVMKLCVVVICMVCCAACPPLLLVFGVFMLCLKGTFKYI